jgi:hypothetical protein
VSHLKEIREAMKGGVAMVCATCVKFHEGKARNLETCTAVEDCGSPIVGDTFHEYEGPITDFLRFCFVCGEPSAQGIRVKNHSRGIGVCRVHVEWVVTMTPRLAAPGARLPIAPSEGSRIVVSGYGTSLAETLLPTTKKTLANAMAAMEAGTFKPDNE